MKITNQTIIDRLVKAVPECPVCGFGIMRVLAHADFIPDDYAKEISFRCGARIFVCEDASRYQVTDGCPSSLGSLLDNLYEETISTLEEDYRTGKAAP